MNILGFNLSGFSISLWFMVYCFDIENKKILYRIRLLDMNIYHMILNSGDQCWGKLLLKVMHYNIALLPKKVTNYVT